MSRRAVLALSLLCAQIIAWSPSSLADEKADYQALERQWLAKVLAVQPQRDPRGEDDRLRPVVNYDTDLIEVSSAGGDRGSLLVGGGWQLIGSTIDTAAVKERAFVLVGLRAVFYRAGLWNNQVDAGRSFEEYVLVERGDFSSVVLSRRRLPSPPPENLLGLREPPGLASLEVLHAGPKGAIVLERILLK